MSQSNHLQILTQMGTAAEAFMKTSLNPYLSELQKISDETGQNVQYDMSESVQLVLNTTSTVYFQDMAYFVMLLTPPSGHGLGKLLWA